MEIKTHDFDRNQNLLVFVDEKWRKKKSRTQNKKIKTLRKHVSTKHSTDTDWSLLFGHNLRRLAGYDTTDRRGIPFFSKDRLPKTKKRTAKKCVQER